MKKLITVLIVVLAAIALLVSCSGNGEEAQDELVVGMELAYPPFETKDQQGEPSGVSVDLAKALGEYLQQPVRIENTNWDGLVPSLQTGLVDVVISSMTITAERAESVDFSIPYAHAYLALLVNTKSAVSDIEDLNQPGMVVAVKKGTTGHIYAQNNLTKATINALSSENACVTEVVQGKADAFIYDQLTIHRQNQANPEITKAVLIPFQDSDQWGMAVKKGNTALLNQINDFIEDFRAEGGFATLTEKHLAAEKTTFDDLGFPWFFD